MIDNRAFIKEYIVINSSFNILKNILLGIAMLMKPDKSYKNLFPEDRINEGWTADQSLQNLN